MNWRSLAHFLLFSLPAAAVGSVFGTMLMAGYELLPCATCYTPPRIDTGPILGIMLLSVVGTYPGALLLGVPVAYPLRHRIAAHPWRWALPMMAIGAAVASLASGWAFWSPARGGYYGIAVLWPYSSATALGFVVAIARSARRGTLDPP